MLLELLVVVIQVMHQVSHHELCLDRQLVVSLHNQYHRVVVLSILILHYNILY